MAAASAVAERICANGKAESTAINNAGVTAPDVPGGTGVSAHRRRRPYHQRGLVRRHAGAFVFLASDAASYITGQVSPVDGVMVM